MTASQLAFPNLSIRMYRGFQYLNIPKLGRVTLITGKNNTGKTSVLEALRLLAERAAPDVLNDILSGRGEYLPGSPEDSPQFAPSAAFDQSVLFHGCPNLDDDFEPIVIETKDSSNCKKITLNIEWVDFRPRRGSPDAAELPGLYELEDVIPKEPALVVSTDDGSSVLRLDHFDRFSSQWIRSEQRRMQCRFVGASGTSLPMEEMWDQAVLRNEEKDVVRALQTVEPSIAAIRMVGGGVRSRRGKTPVVRLQGLSRYVPLPSLGEGVNRILKLVLSLLDARNGLVLIDEIDTGLHFSAQIDAWRIVFDMAQRHEIQVLATTHSWDAIEAFQAAAAASEEEGILLRLSRHGEDIVSTEFTEDDLGIVTERRIEVR